MGNNNWQSASIEKLIEDGTITAHKDGNYGSNYPRKNEFGLDGVPLLTAKALNDSGGHIDFESAPRLNIEKANKLTYGFIESGDVLLSHNATVGRVAVVPALTERILVGTSLTYYRVDSNRLLPRYLAAYFAGRDFQNQLKSVMSHSTRNQVPITTQRRLSIVLPPLPHQRAIAHILGSLDDKIELNRRMNETLEGMAQALFRSWFVDFDPVLDNAIVAGNPIPEELAARAELRRQALNNNTANREAAKPFPASFQFTEELGWIPEGWEAATLGDYLEIKRGGSPRPIHDYLRPEGLPWVKIADATKSDSRFLFETKEFIKPEGLKKTVLMKKGSLILSNSATPGLPMFLELDACIHDGWLHFPQKKHFGNLFLYQLFLVIREELVGKGNGSVFTNLKTDILRAQRIVVPPVAILNTFETWMEGNFERLLQVNTASRTLTKLRDTLLPKLISGELRIPDAEQLVEDALA